MSCRSFSNSTTDILNVKISPTSVWMLNHTFFCLVFRNDFPVIHFSVSSSPSFSSLFTRHCTASANTLSKSHQALLLFGAQHSVISTLSSLGSRKHFCPRRKYSLSASAGSPHLKNQYQSITSDQDQTLPLTIRIKPNVLSQ